MTEPSHARLSPSGADRWSVCPGSVILEAAEPDNSNEHSDWGTAAHAVAAMCLTEQTDAAAYLGRRIDVAPCRTVECDREMAEAVQQYVDYVRQAADGAELLVEQRFDISHVVPECFGTSDAVVIRADELHIIDAKFGRGVPVYASYAVDPANPASPRKPNKQMALYALGALRELELVADFKRVRMTIHQPRLNSVDEWDCSVIDLLAAGEDLSAAAERAYMYVDSDTPPAPSDLVPGEKQCKFCKAKATCPALAQRVQDEVGSDFDNLVAFGQSDEQKVMTIKALTPKTPEALGKAMAAIDLIESWCKAVRGAVEVELLAGREVPGYKLVQGRKGARAWTSEGEAEAALKSMRLKTDEMYSFKLITPPAAEKLVKAGTLGPRQWAKLQPLIGQSEGGKSVAPASDPRPALVIAPPADDFDEVKQPEEDLA
ncbi:putative phage protein p38 [Cupriavidus taiwanensis]|uniref:DUF2800 domain-containing protein n=1 Tax=Cupriavidus taiwanensis TaxID=164546 RepID=UPI000E18991E|nr:DUF2800 domain-containing protein [Cupriavidus taiwanensis]SPA25908.1 putative phage protein p38 [Cupriavidus taiwanensis]